MSILSTIIGWFIPTPKQETPAQKAQRISARIIATTTKANKAALEAALDAATTSAAMQRAQTISELDSAMVARRVRLAEQAAVVAKVISDRHMARLEACDRQEAALHDFDYTDDAAAAHAAKAAPILAAYREALESLTSEEILTGGSDQVDTAMRAMRKMAGLV